MPRGFDIPREALEAGWEDYEDQLAQCALGKHDLDQGEWVEDVQGTFLVRHCRACYAEVQSNSR